MGLTYKLLRTAAGHANSFYATVGIVLVAGVVIAILGIIGFAMLGEWVKEGGTQATDVAILQWMRAQHTPTLTRLMTEVTYLGTGTVVLVIVGVSAMFLWHTEHKLSARMLLFAVAGSIVLNNALKLVFQRDRPSVFSWETHAVSLSFPSGHAMSATVCYGTVAYLVMRLQKHRISRVLTGLAAVTIILMICATRLYLGVHYPTDVIGGIICGIAWSAFCMAVLEASIVLGRRRAPLDVVDERPAAAETATT
jgi:undecaprenyl-diphosphatase